jgi:HAD superfamily hydrolase (TIGR01458 family)
VVVAELAIRGILFDLDGVIYLGEQLIAGAVEALEWVRARKIPHLFVTNTTSRPRAALCAKLAGMGISVQADSVLSPPVAAVHWLRANTQGPAALFIPEATRVEFDGLPLWNGDSGQSVASVVLGDLGQGWDFPRLNQAFLLLMQQPAPRLVALGMTRYWRASDGLRLDAGPFVAALQYATGIQPVVTGKPAAAFFHSGAGALGLEPAELLMIGDDIRGDIGAAQQAGLHAALVKTGKFQQHDLQGDVKPDVVLGSIAELPGWWQQHTDA